MTYTDPQAVWKEKESGMTPRKLIAFAKKQGWPTTKIYGRTWISAEHYREWLSEHEKIADVKKKCFAYWCLCEAPEGHKYCGEQCKRFAKLYRDEYGIEANINNGKAMLGNGHLYGKGFKRIKEEENQSC